MSRTITRDQTDLLIPWGGVKFGSQPSPNREVTIIFRPGDDVPGTGLHWHETHTEYLQVVQGYALITIDDRTEVFTKDDGIITIPRYAVHQYMRADSSERGRKGRDVDLIVREWTEPADGDKEVFFRNILSLLMDRKDTVAGNSSMFLSIVVVAWAHDNYPVFWKGPSMLGRRVQDGVRRGLTYVVMGSLAMIGRFIGYKPDYPEYTPR